MGLDSAGDAHVKVENEKAVALQEVMAELKKNSRISKQTETKSRKSRASQKLDGRSMMRNIPTCRPPTKPQNTYNSIIQYNFGKLDIVQLKNQATINKEQPRESGFKRIISMNDKTRKSQLMKERKVKITIKETNLTQEDHTLPKAKLNEDVTSSYNINNYNLTVDENSINNNKQEGNDNSGTKGTIKCVSKDGKISNGTRRKEKNTKSKMTTVLTQISTKLGDKKSLNIKKIRRFAEGYTLFRMEDELNDVEEEFTSDLAWLSDYARGDGQSSQIISETNIQISISQLEEIFNRIINRYESTWRKQYEEGYQGASGDAQELLSLMAVLPHLEEYHLKRLTDRWDKFRCEARRCARDSHTMYGAMVNEMRSFLLEFEAQLERRNIRAEQDRDEYIVTYEALKNINGTCVRDASQNYERSHNVKTVQPDQSIEDKSKTASESEVVDFIGDIDLDRVARVSEIGNGIYKLDSDMMVQEVNNRVNAFSPSYYTVVKENQLITNNNELVIEESRRVLETSESTLAEETDSISNDDQEVYKSIDTSLLHDLFKLNSYNNLNKGVSLKGRENSALTMLKPPPGFETFGCLLGVRHKHQSHYCGSQYVVASLALWSLPACQTELVPGLRLARFQYNGDFKLFNGCNFGDIQLGLSSEGVPQAVRRFQKLNSLCNKQLVATLRRLVTGLVGLYHGHVLPYTGACDTSADLLLTMPLCQMDLGQCVRQMRAGPAHHTHHSLLSLVKQMVKGLHYLHTLPNPVIHGNLKPSNILVDCTGNLRLAEFGLHQAIFQQQGPSLASMIWWARETINHYQSTRMMECTQQTDIQSTGMLAHFILSLGHHPFGYNLPDIVQNICSGLMMLSPQETLTMDLIKWMLSHQPNDRPTTTDILRHVMFWSFERRWEFLVRCCGRGAPSDCPIGQLHADLDQLGLLQEVNTKWISVLKQSCERNIGCAEFNETPSGLLKFLDANLDSWCQIQLVFLDLFSFLPLNFMRLLEQTRWISHPHFQPFTALLDL